eukprot:CAMPEP_0179052098 /NCGR_PEP_ID=MMETSP0796-20121207/21583_1 /TAXON_ID=73915 /ORGANISM="Pyrodinium bahamense, Strain pbaha01" /LENGTH=435 /DNA_ID=CAMNT_0020748655 /DNA_START=43 /DNA_END=1350 /DNA_ORIENTATION=+
MGGFLSAPVSAAATCLGGCTGSCLAVMCGTLAGSGSVGSERAARCLLVWLQSFAALVALFAAATPSRWLPWTCSKLDTFGAGDLGICGCGGGPARERCWSDQLAYRAEAAAFVLFLALLVMTVSGCAQGASRTHAVAKFMAIPLLGIALLFVPNSALSTFGSIATSASAIFLAAQALLLIDFAYTWNETWHGYALTAQRRQVGTSGRRAQRVWYGCILAASALLFVTSIAFAIYLYSAFPGATGRAINIAAVVLCLVLLFVSITDWCEHGALLTSCVVLLYTVWLICEALASQPGAHGSRPPTWLGLCLCAGSLAASAWGSGLAGAPSARAPVTSTAAATSAEAGSVDPEAASARAAFAAEAEDGGAGSRLNSADVKDFALQCAVHALASLYVASALAPEAGQCPFVLRVLAIFASLALYGWSLAAPKILTSRTF